MRASTDGGKNFDAVLRVTRDDNLHGDVHWPIQGFGYSCLAPMPVGATSDSHARRLWNSFVGILFETATPDSISVPGGRSVSKLVFGLVPRLDADARLWEHE